METLISRMYIWVCLCLCVCLACSKQTDNIETIFSEVESIVEQQPDSALSLLDSILFPEKLKESQYNQFILLQIQAKDKSYKDITSDTIIFAVKEYFVKRKDFPNAALTAFYCGRVLREQNKVEKAITAYFEAEKYAEYTDDNNLKGLIQGNLSSLYFDHLVDDKAIACGKRAVFLYNKAGNYRNEINALLLIGNCFLFGNEMDSAFYYYNKGLKLADSCKIIVEQVKTRQNISVAYREVGEFQHAKNLLHEALKFAIDNNIEEARLLLNLSKIFIVENQIDSAMFYIERSMSLHAQETKLLLSTYLQLSEIKKSEYRYKEALQYFEEYNTLVLKSVEENKHKELLELQGKYDLEKLKNKNINLVIEHQKAMLIFSFAFLCSTFIALFFYGRFRFKKKKLSEAEQKIETLKKMAQNYSTDDDKHSFRNILLHHFDILKKVAVIEREISDEDMIKGESLLNKFNQIVYGQDKLDWDKLYLDMNKLKNGFYDLIHSQYPQMNDLEFRICCLTCENFDDTEIAIITGLSIHMVQRRRSDIRKKLGVLPHGDVFAFLSESLLKKD